MRHINVIYLIINGKVYIFIILNIIILNITKVVNMMECETTTRKWGNSLGITLPKSMIEEGHIKENEKIKVLIMRQSDTLRKTFGMVKGLKKSTQKIKDELRDELYNA